MVGLKSTSDLEQTFNMVLDPMTGEEQEPQDLRIVIAHKVKGFSANIRDIEA